MEQHNKRHDAFAGSKFLHNEDKVVFEDFYYIFEIF